MTSAYEWIALVTGIASAILLVRNNLLTWPVGIVSLIAYAVVMYGAKMYGNMTVQFVFILQSIYGWYHWNRHDRAGDLPITSFDDPLSFRRVVIILAIMSLAIVFSNLLNSGNALLDGTITAFSLIALSLSIWRKLENWYFWIALDLLSIYYFYQEGLYVGALSYVLFLVVATTGYFQWRKLSSPASS